MTSDALVSSDLGRFDPNAPLTNTPPSDYEGPCRNLTPSDVPLHVLEELAQHHGQVEQSRDVLVQTPRVAS